MDETRLGRAKNSKTPQTLPTPSIGKSESRSELLGLLCLADLFLNIDASKSAHYQARYRDFADLRAARLKLPRKTIARKRSRNYHLGILEIARGEQKDGLRLLHASLDVFNRIGYDWRAARCLIRIYEATRNSHMLGMAREKLRNYPEQLALR